MLGFLDGDGTCDARLFGPLVEVHHADEKGYCRGCMAPGGTLFVRWPCGLHRLATAATAPPPKPPRRFGPHRSTAHRADDDPA